MKTENDIIAEYVRRNFPEILETTDFAVYRLHESLNAFGQELWDSIVLRKSRPLNNPNDRSIP